MRASSCFRASTRFQTDERPDGITEEVELAAANHNALLRRDWNEVMSFLSTKMVWLSEVFFLTVNDSEEELEECHLNAHSAEVELLVWPSSSGDDNVWHDKIHIWRARDSQESLQGPVDLLLNLLRDSHVPGLVVEMALSAEEYFADAVNNPMPVSIETLERFVTRHATLETLRLRFMNISEAHLSVLLNADSTNLELDLCDCESAGHEGLAARQKHSNGGGPKKIVIDFSVEDNLISLLDKIVMLCGRPKTKSLTIWYSGSDYVSLCVKIETIQKVASVLRTLPKLVELYTSNWGISDKGYSILWQSIGTHPALEFVSLDATISDDDAMENEEGELMSFEERLAYRTRALAESVQWNSLLKTIDVNEDERDEDIWETTVQPRLDFNVFGPRFDQISQMEQGLRKRLVPNVLAAIQSKPHLLHAFLKDHSDSIFDRVVSQAATCDDSTSSERRTEEDAVAPKRKRSKRKKAKMNDR